MAIKFEDNVFKITEALTAGISAFLHEAGGEIQSRTQRNSRVDTGETKGSYSYKVQESAESAEVTIGSNLENAIWEEFGTGEYAVNGDGRKSGWVYKSNRDGKFYYTTGKKPNKPMLNAFNATKGDIKKRLGDVIKNNI